MKNVFILFVLLAGIMQVQEVKSQKTFKKLYYKEVNLENSPVTISISDGVSTEAYLKFKLTVKNSSNDYIMIRTGQIILKANGKEYRNTEKDMVVGPNDDDSRVVDIKANDLRVDQFSLELSGFSRISAESGVVKAENFKLPVAKNEFSAGSFSLVHVKSVKKTDNVGVRFNVTYNGDQAGIVHPGMVVLRTPKATEFANMASRNQRKPFVLSKGQTESFTVVWRDIPVSNGDMQFVEIDLLWNNCFRSATSKEMSLPEVEVVLDKALTEGKNK